MELRGARAVLAEGAASQVPATLGTPDDRSLPRAGWPNVGRGGVMIRAMRSLGGMVRIGAALAIAALVAAACSSSSHDSAPAASTSLPSATAGAPAPSVPTPANLVVANVSPAVRQTIEGFGASGAWWPIELAKFPRRRATLGRDDAVHRRRHRAVGLPLQHRRRWRGRHEPPSARRRSSRTTPPGSSFLRAASTRGRADPHRLRQQRAAALHDERQGVRRQSEAGHGSARTRSTSSTSSSRCTTATTSRCSTSAR